MEFLKSQMDSREFSTSQHSTRLADSDLIPAPIRVKFPVLDVDSIASSEIAGTVTDSKKVFSVDTLDIK